VSYVAQTQKPTPVILYPPECVDGAAIADSWLSFLARCAPGAHQVAAQRPHPANRHSAFFIRVHAAKSPPNTIRPWKLSNIVLGATPRNGCEAAGRETERSKIMPLLQLLEVLVVVGVLLWLVNRFIPMQGAIKSILNGVVFIALVLWLLNAFGLFHSLSRVRIRS
jgi:hypothetical protein